MSDYKGRNTDLLGVMCDVCVVPLEVDSRDVSMCEPHHQQCSCILSLAPVTTHSPRSLNLKFWQLSLYWF